MIFKTVEDEATKSGKRITNTFVDSIKSINSKSSVNLGSAFESSLQNDINALQNYKTAVLNNVDSTEALKNCMSGASQAAIQYAKSMDASKLSTDQFAQQQRISQISTLAQDKSLGNVNKLLNEYNIGCRNVGVSQKEFVDTVGKSNTYLGKYLSGLNGSKASMNGYVKSLVGAKVASVGLRIATTALNMAISMGISVLVSGAISAITEFVDKIHTSAEEAKEAAEEIHSAFNTNTDKLSSDISTLQNLEEEFGRLSKGVTEYGENISLTSEEYNRYKDIVNQIVDISPELCKGYDDEGNAIANNNNLIQDSIDLLKEKQRLELLGYTSDESLKATGMQYAKEIKDFKEENPLNYGNAKYEFGEAFANAANAYISRTDATGNYDVFKATGLDFDWNEYSGGGNELTYAQTFAQDYYDQLVEDIRSGNSKLREVFTEEEIDTLARIANTHDKNIEQYNRKLENITKPFNYQLQLVAQATNEYDQLNTAEKTFLSTYIEGFSIGADTTEDDIVEMKYQIEDFVKYLSDDNSSISKAINNVFSADKSEMSIEEYIEYLTKNILYSGQSPKTMLQLKDFFGLTELSNKYSNIQEQFSLSNDDESKIKEFNDWLNSLSATDFEIVYDVYLNTDTSKYTLKDWEDALLNEINKISEEDKISFSDLIADEEFTQSVDDHIDKVKSLQDAYQSLQEGKEIDLPKLFKEFPELADDADNLDVAISSLLEAMTSDVTMIFNSQFGNLRTDEDVTALTNYMNAVLELSRVSKSATEDIVDFVDVIDSFNASNDILKTAEKEMENGDGISVDTIESLKSITEDYLDYLYVENGLIKLNTDAWRERNKETKESTVADVESQIASLQDEKRALEERLKYWQQWEDFANTRGASTALAADEIANITEELESNGEEITDLEHLLELLRNALVDVNEDSNSFVDALSKIQNLSSGLDLLDEIYTDISNGEDFDWSSILNNDNFVDAFGDLGDAYTDFIKTVANSPNDIESCQQAFDNLATAYIRNSKALDGLTEENRDWTVSYLEHEGIANATAIVDAKLAYNKERLKYTTGEYANATYDEIDALYQECKAGTLTQQVLAELATEKLRVNSNGIKTSSDIEQLITLANSANATVASLERLSKVRSLIERSEQLDPYINAPDATQDFIEAALDHQAKLLAQAQELLATPLEYDEIDPSKFIADYTGGEGSGDGSKKSEDTFDWIEIAVDRVESAISKLDSKANSIYESWSDRNKSLKDEISEVRNEIDLQTSAYNRYMQEANNVGLPSSWAKKVRNGEVDISTITDNEDLVDKIEEYQNWYEKAISCQDAIEELKETEKDLYRQSFDNISSQYDNILSTFEHEKNMLDEYISQTESKGYIVSAKYYDALIGNEKNSIAQLKKERDGLTSSLNNALDSGKIVKYSEAWYDMSSKINDVNLAIEESNTAIIEYGNSIRDIKWEVFDLLQEKISQVAQESEFLMNLMSYDDLYDDRGQLTNEGMSTMGLHGVNYNVYMAQADKYAQEILNIDKELANDPYNQDLVERRQELLELQQDSIISAEEEKQAIKDMVQEGFDLELNALQELIDKRNEALDSAKDLYDYQKNIANQTKEIASLEKQMSAYAGDTSEETKAKIQQIQVSLQEAKDNLEETEYERYISDQEKLLDELYTEYESVLNQRLDNIDALIGDMISAVNDNASTIGSTLSEKADSVGYVLSDAMSTIWNDDSTRTTDVLTTYGQDIVDGISSVETTVNKALGAINDGIQDIISDLEISYDSSNIGNQSSNNLPQNSQTNVSTNSSNNTIQPSNNITPNSSAIVVGGKINAGSAKIYDYVGDTSGEKQYYSNDPIYTVLSESNGYIKVRHHKLSTGTTGWFKKSDVKAYKTGKQNFSSDEIAWTQDGGAEMIIRPSDGAILTPIARRDSVLSTQASGNIWDMANYPADFIRDNLGIDSIDAPNNVATKTTYTQYLDKVVFSLPNVKNYDELLKNMQQDKNFERLILSFTIDQIAGKSSLAKGKAIR